MRTIILLAALVYSLAANGESDLKWPFDQAENVAAITTKQVVQSSLPILMVVHYEDDDSWAFTCGTTNKSEDLMIVGMGEIVNLDSTLYSIADLPPGWSAVRESVGSEWVRTKDE
ncbi:hypothetical protein ACJJIW_12755 [Microbulbifer sp. JMSA004]|uniref:hypothetical protein n=1 Tax=Microbulbifer sp. JMSA004 TaxID=3243370 RepID=UPI00403A2D33